MSKPANRLENLATLRTANVDSAFANAFGGLAAGSILIGFVKYLGGSDLWIGLLAGVPSVLGLLQIPGAIWGKRFGTYKQFVMYGGIFARLFYVPLIVLPVLDISGAVKLTLIVICVCCSAAASLVTNATYNEWLAELVPPASRGYFYSRRNAICSIFGATAGLFGGIIVDVFKSHGHERWGFVTVFALGSIASSISFYYFMRMAETPRPVVAKQNLSEAIRELAKPLVDRNYRTVLFFAAATIFGQTFAGNFFTAFALESLKLPFTILTLSGLTQSLGTVVASPFCGFLADKYGNKPILIISGFCLTITPLMWQFCYPLETSHNAWVLLPASFLVGMVWAAVNVSQFNLYLATSPADERASYIGIALTTQAIIGFVSPIIGAQVMVMLRPQSGDATAAYKLLFDITMALRFVAVFALIPVFEQGALRVRTTLRDLSKITPKGFSAMRTLTRSGDVSTREEAIRQVADRGLSLAGDELIKALHDPSPRIRRQAAVGLSRLADPNAVGALIHQLEEHPDLVEEETVDALGQLGGPEAVGPITRLLKDPRSLVRRAAVRALGRIGETSAIPALIEVATEGDADVRRASLRSLRNLEAEGAHEVFSTAILDPSPSVRIAAAEGVAELGIRDAADNCRMSLDLFHDEASSEVAYALGAVGSDEDIPLILDTAAECVSMITRRRCLLSVARLLGVERAVYKLLLLDGMGRDAAVLDLTSHLAKKSKRLNLAVDKFSSGSEGEALAVVAHTLKQPILHFMARRPVDELFLVVVCYLTRVEEK